MVFVLIGDLNFSDQEASRCQSLISGRCVDAWTSVNPDSAGFTWDPAHNPQAGKTSRTGVAGRLDRCVLWTNKRRDPDDDDQAAFLSLLSVCRPVQAQLFGTSVVDSIQCCPSDHYGVEYKIVLGDEQSFSLLLANDDNVSLQLVENMDAYRQKFVFVADSGRAMLTASVDSLFSNEEEQVQDQEEQEEENSIRNRKEKNEEIVLTHEEAFAVVTEALDQCMRQGLGAGSPCIVCPVGSLGLHVCDVQSDVDVFLASFVDRDRVFRELPRLLAVWQGRQGGHPVGVIETVVDSKAAILRLAVGGLHVDCSYCQLPRSLRQDRLVVAGQPASPELLISKLAVQLQRGELDQQSETALYSVLDQRLLCGLVRPQLLQFRRLYATVKQWSRRNHIYSGKTGFLNGLSVAVMCADLVLRGGLTWTAGNDDDDDDDDDLVSQFCSFYAKHKDPVRLDRFVSGAGADDDDQRGTAVGGDVFPVYSPSTNSVIVRNATRSTVYAMHQCMRRRHQSNASEKSPWSVFDVCESAVQVQVQGSGSATQFLRWRSFVLSRLVGLCKRVEQRASRLGADLVLALVWPSVPKQHETRQLVAADHGGPAVFSASYYVGIGHFPDDLVRVDLRQVAEQAAQDFLLSVSAWSEKTESMQLAALVLSSDDAAACAQALRASLAGQPRQNLDLIEKQCVYDFRSRCLALVNEGVTEAAAAAATASAAHQQQQQVQRQHVQQQQQRQREQALQKKARRTTKQLLKLEEKEMEKAASIKKSRRLTPIIDIMNRVKYDESMNAAEYDLVFVDRFLGDVRVRLLDFDIENIPMHRIKEVYHGSKLVWSKELRFDLLTGK